MRIVSKSNTNDEGKKKSFSKIALEGKESRIEEKLDSIIGILSEILYNIKKNSSETTSVSYCNDNEDSFSGWTMEDIKKKGKKTDSLHFPE